MLSVRTLLALVGAAAAGAAAQSWWSDEQLRRRPYVARGWHEGAHEVVELGRDDVRTFAALGEDETMTGLWRNEFESQCFIASGGSECARFQVDEGLLCEAMVVAGWRPGWRYPTRLEVTFKGRRASDAKRYGLSWSSELVVAESFISVRLLDAGR